MVSYMVAQGQGHRFKNTLWKMKLLLLTVASDSWQDVYDAGMKGKRSRFILTVRDVDAPLVYGCTFAACGLTIQLGSGLLDGR